MAWCSGEDIIKDLADLDEFDGYGNNDSYNILYSLERGIKSKEKSNNSNFSFIDPRSGEEIHLDDSDSDVGSTFYRTKGRGKVLGFSSGHSSQLQKQLRLARPLGSSDMIFESFWRRNIPNDKTEKNSMSASNSESDSQRFESSNEMSEFVFPSSKNKGVIACRNSKLQSNALISNLLSKNFQKMGESDQNI